MHLEWDFSPTLGRDYAHRRGAQQRDRAHETVSGQHIKGRNNADQGAFDTHKHRSRHRDNREGCQQGNKLQFGFRVGMRRAISAKREVRMDYLLAVDRVGMNEECRARIVAREQQQTNDGQYFTSCLLHSVCLFLECKDSVFNDFLQMPESRKKWSISRKKAVPRKGQLLSKCRSLDVQ